MGSVTACEGWQHMGQGHEETGEVIQESLVIQRYARTEP